MLKNSNRPILYLTLSDSFVWGPFIIIANLTSLYLSERLGTDTASFVGIGTGIYFLTRGILQIPIGTLIDKTKNDKDEIILLTLGVVLMGLPFLFYPMIIEPYQFYILQFIFGLGVSLSLPTWRKLFAVNLEEGKEGASYGFYETILSFSTVIFSVVIGYVANLGDVYFDWAMRGASILMMLAGGFVLLILTVKERKSHNGHLVLPVEKVVK